MTNPPSVPDAVAANAPDPHERAVPGNHPLPLDDPRFAWQLIGGWADLFVVLPGPRGRVGHRVHLFRAAAESSDFLFGVAPGPGGMRLLAAGTVATRVRPFSRDELRQALAEAARPEQFVALVDRWVKGLTGAVSRERPAPRDAVPLVAGAERSWKAGEALSSGRATAWVRAEKVLRFLGPDGPSLGSEEVLFPLHAPGWLSSEADVRLTALSTKAVLADPRAWAGLDLFHRVVLDWLARQASDALKGQKDRQERRVQRDGKMLGDGIATLTGVDLDERDEPLPPEVEADPLFQACRLIGARIGVVIRNPPGALERTQSGQTVASSPGWTLAGFSRSLEQGRRADPVEAIARASRIRVRRVRLEGDWWRQDNGPLLVFRQVDARPLALLPTAPTRYEVADTTTGKYKALTPADGRQLDPDRAYQFFRPLPARSLTPWRLFYFAFAGTGRDWAWVFVLGLAGALVALFPPIVTGWVFDWIIPGGASQRFQLLLVTVALAAAASAGVLFRLARSVAILRLETRMDIGAQAGLWDRLLDLPPPFFRQYAVGDLASRMGGVGSIRWLLTDAALSAVLNLAFSLVYFILLVYYDLTLAGLAAGIFVVVLGVTVYASLKQLPYQRRAYHARGQTAGLVLQLLTGLPRLRAADAIGRALAVWTYRFGTQRRLEYRARRIGNALDTFATVTPILGTVVLFALVAFFPRSGLSLGAFLAFNAAFVRLISSALSFSNTTGALIEVVPLYERVRPVLDAVAEADVSGTVPGDLRGEIEARHVSFRYQADGPLVLDDISLHVRPGEFVAFVGASGAGKSTLLRLLLGFEKPTAGAVFYDREDMSGLDLQSLRRQVGVVLQTVRPLPGTIRDNILGAAPLTDEDAWAAARLVGLDDYIRGLPDGMNTMLEEVGGDLSGGQRQLLMIARAIACRPRILFFDEATSALDNATQARVTGGLEVLRATRIIVAHRLSTVRNADRIVVFDAGRIVEEGNYTDLMALPGGRFRELVRRQQTESTRQPPDEQLN